MPSIEQFAVHFFAGRRAQPQMLPPAIIERPAARGPGDQAELDQIGFDHFLDRVARFGQAGRQRFHADRAALVDVGDHGEIAPVHRVEAEPIDLQPGQRLIGDLAVTRPSPRHGEIAHPPEQAAGDARRAPRAARDFARAVAVNVQIQQPRSAVTTCSSLLGVEIEPHRNAEAVAQRRGQQPLPRGRADQREGGRSIRTSAPTAPRR